MPSTYQVYTADGVTTSFPVPFEYLDPSYVKAKVNGVDADGAISDGFFELVQRPASGSTVVVYRETPVDPLVVFSDRTTVDEEHLDLVVQQFSNTIEETQSGFLQTYGSGIDPVVANPDTPTVPTNVTASPLFTSINVSWDKPTFRGYKTTEVWRSLTDDFLTAELVYVTFAGQITDVVGYDKDFYYWVRHVNSDDQVGETQGDGVLGSTPDSAFSDDYLNQLITTSGSGLADQIANANSQIAYITERINGAHSHLITVDDRLTEAEVDLTGLDGQVTSNASAITAIDARVTTNESTLTSHASDISQLQTDVVNIDYEGSAVAISALDTRVTQTETDITAQSSDITQLQADVTNNDSDISANTTAITGLDTRVTSAEGTISTHTSDITQLQSDMALVDVNATTTALTNLDTRVTATETSITAQSGDITQLQTDVTAANTGISGNTTAINGLDTRVTTAETTLVAHAADITQLQTDVTNLDVAGQTAAISALDTRVSANETDIAANSTSITQLQTNVVTLSNSATVNTTAVNSLDTRVTATEADIVSNASDITQLQSDVTAAQGDATANATAINSLDLRTTSNETTLTSHASSLTSLSTSVGDNQADISTLTTSVNGVEARWDVKSNVNDLEGGVGFFNDGVSTKFVINADSTVTGGTINGSTINGSTLQTAETGERVSISSADNRVHFYWDSGDTTIREYLELGQAAEGADSYAVKIGASEYQDNGIYARFDSTVSPTFLYGTGGHSYLSYSEPTDTATPTLEVVGGYQAALKVRNTAFSTQPSSEFTSEVTSPAIKAVSNVVSSSTARAIEVVSNSDGVRSETTGAGRSAIRAECGVDGSYAFRADLSTTANSRGLYVDGDSSSADNAYGAYIYMGGSNAYGVYSRADEATSYSFYATGAGTNYGPFTGAHDALLDKAKAVPQAGDIVKTLGVKYRSSISNVITEVEIQDTAEAKDSFGVVTCVKDLPDDNSVAGLLNLTDAEYATEKGLSNLAIVNGVGEGQVNVCDEGGNIEIGDFICSATVAGKGKTYNGSDMRLVVARAIEAVDWSMEASNEKTIGCIYMCG